jgi:hypothetical protein
MFQEIIFMMVGGWGGGGKLSEIKCIFPEFTINCPISCMSVVVDFLPRFLSSFGFFPGVFIWLLCMPRLLLNRTEELAEELIKIL